ncbi:hypothetical protein D3C71_901530 [compost metagenome]
MRGCTRLLAKLAGHRLLRARPEQTVHVERATRLGTCAGEPFAAKRLHPDHGAHYVAVDVEVADLGGVDHLGYGLVDAGMDPQGQAVAAVIDLREQLTELGAGVAHQVQHWAEHLRAQLIQAVEFDQGWQHEGAAVAGALLGAGNLVHPATLVSHGLDVALYVGLGLGVDDRADVGGEVLGAADLVLGHGTLEHTDHPLGDVVLHAQHPQGGAALTGAVERRGDDVHHHLFGESGGVDDHGVLAAGLGDERNGAALGVEATGQVAGDDTRHLGGAGEHDAAHSLVRDERRPHGLTPARQQLHRTGGDAGLTQDAYRLRRDERGLLGRLGEHRIAGRERRADLAAEDGQREVPGADADNGTERSVALVGEVVARLGGVVAQEVHRLAHLGDGVGEGLAGFAHQQAHQGLQLGFHQIGGAIQHGGTLGRRSGLPDLAAGQGAGEGLVHQLDRGFAHLTDDVAVIRRVDHVLELGRRLGVATRLFITQHGQGLIGGVGAGEQGGGQRSQTVLVREIQAGGVRASLAVQLTGQGNARVGQTQAAFTGGHLLDLLYRILHQILQGDAVVRDAVDEGGVGPVLQQAAHQVGEQGLVAADRRIDAAGATQLAVGDLADHLFVERFTHAVQALELVLARVVVLPRQLVDGRQRMGVVGGELGIDGLGHRQQLAGAGEIGDIGVGLAGIDGVTLQAILLGALDLAVPVGALHQPDHQAVTAALGEIDDVVDHIGAALLIGLDDEADAVPVRERRVEAELFQQVEGDLQPIGLLGVDVDADVVLPGELGQPQ